MRRLTAAQVDHLRSIVNDHQTALCQRLAGATGPEATRFYQERLAAVEALLKALPERGGAEMEGDTSDEQRDEDESEDA